MRDMEKRRNPLIDWKAVGEFVAMCVVGGFFIMLLAVLWLFPPI